jgi:Glyoxalase/Bleomycin resistance protein/Dioxygenase superfamily
MCSTRGCEGSATSDRPTRCGGDGSIGKKEAHMPGINGIAHVELSVRDLDKSVRWYCELLGAQDAFRATNDAYRITACAIFEPRSKLVLAFIQHREEEPSEFGGSALTTTDTDFLGGAQVKSWNFSHIVPRNRSVPVGIELWDQRAG